MRAASTLETAFRNNQKGSLFVWEVDKNRSIWTRPSPGKYEPSNGGGKIVVGGCSWIWQLKKVDSKHAAVAGIVSLKISLSELVTTESGDKHKALCEWNFDIGDHSHPGALVHTQVCSVNGDGHLLSVPRFPSVILAPTDALDFLLGELFQEEWQKEAASVLDKSPKLARRMRMRLVNFLQEQANYLANAPGLAVHALKVWKPLQSLKL